VLRASGALAACNSPFNILRAIDGPYISPERRAEMAYRAAQEQQRLVAEASEHVRSFDWADVAEQTHAVYEELAAGLRQPSG